MHMRILIATTLLSIILPAGAATIRYTASGALSPNFGTVPVPAGTVISLEVFLDESTADADPDSLAGNYAGLTGTLTVGSDIFSVNDYSFRQVRVNNSLGGSADRIQLAFLAGDFTSPDIATISGIRLQNLFFTLFASGATAISNDLLSTTIGLDLAEWPTKEVVVQFANGTGYVGEANGPMNTYTSAIVPAPAAVWLFASALGLLGWMRRKGG